MPEISIQKMAEELLSGTLVADDNEEHNLLGYRDQRKTYTTPDGVPGEYVVRVESDNTDSFRPSPVEEGLGNLRSGYLSAKSILEKQDPRPVEKLEQLESYYQSKCQALETITCGERIFANLTEKEDEKAESGPQSEAYMQNKHFRARLKQVNKEVGDFFVHAAAVAGVKVKDLEKEGHRLRSKGRPTLVHEFKDPNAPDSSDTKFVIYIPAGRLTDRQMKLRAQQGITDDSRAHSTTSHHKKGFVHGNSSFVRMVVGTKSADGTVTITHDSFSGPGARMPYKDLKHGVIYDGAKEKQNNMAVKAITFMNQEEIIQSVAQRIYDKKLAGKGVAELTQLFEKEGKTPPAFTGDREADRKALIDAYFKQTDLVEAYTQVISPSQAKIPFADGSDANREQFEYVRDAIRAFSGATDLKLNIDDGSEAGLTVEPQSYKGNHCAFGVNAFRQFNSIESEQNTRFINSMIDETFASIDASKLPDDVRVKYDALQQAMLGGDTVKVEALQAQVKDVEAELVDLNKDYRTAMMDYAEVYQKYQNVKNDPKASSEDKKAEKKAVETSFKTVSSLESQVKKKEAKIDGFHKKIEDVRKAAFTSNAEDIQAKLTELKQAVTENPTPELTSLYNRMAYLVDAQDLYYSGNWKKSEYNFEMQTLLASLATELDMASTKGCKSNNDRGQRLAQQVATNAILVDGGLYEGQFRANQGNVKEPAANVQRQLLTIQTMHHRANASVGGGKFGVKLGKIFSDNGLWGKIASMAKQSKYEAKPAWQKSPGRILATICTFGFMASKFEKEDKLAREQEVKAVADTYTARAEAKVETEVAIDPENPELNGSTAQLDSPTSVVEVLPEWRTSAASHRDRASMSAADRGTDTHGMKAKLDEVRAATIETDELEDDLEARSSLTTTGGGR